MDFITVDAAACKRDGMCLAVCPLLSIEADPDGLPRQTKDAQCIACGHCVAVCPHGALANAKVDAGKLRPMPKKLPEAAALRDLMLSRRSIRAYADTPVDKAVLAGLIDTARCAPTAVNTQHVSYVACTDPAAVRTAARMAVEWLRKSGIERYAGLVTAWDQGREVVMRGAPAFVLAHAPADYAWGETDCVIALTYLELAVAAAGLGSCWAGLLTRAAQADPDLAKFLGLPEDSTPRGALMIGRPKFRYSAIPPRKPAKITWL